MCARLTVLSDTPIADAIAGCAKPSSRSNTIRRRWRCFSGMFFQRSAFLSRRTSPLLHLIIGPPESEGISQSHRSRQDSAPNYRKPPDSIRSGSGINPIEMAFSKLKPHRRKAAEHTIPGLLRRIGRVVRAFNPEECTNFFRHAGYVQT